jgi:uncharacterized membrane protein YbhN (UPF0104 family)
VRLASSQRLRRILQTGVTLGAFVYLFMSVDRGALLAAFRQLSAAACLLAVLCTSAALGCGVVRWWLIFKAFSAPRQPGLRTLARYYLIGLFYNTYLPGGLSGDVVRGLAARAAFEPGSAAGLGSVLLERVLGLAALLGATGLGLWLHPLPGSARLFLPLAAGCVLTLTAAGALAWSGRLRGLRALDRLQPWLSRLPAAPALLPLTAALLASFGSQLGAALTGHVLVRAIDPAVRLLDSLVIVPLAAATAYLPISISGIGVREAVFVELYARVRVPAQAALAASLSLWLVQASVAALGGMYVLLGRGGLQLQPTAAEPERTSRPASPEA